MSSHAGASGVDVVDTMVDDEDGAAGLGAAFGAEVGVGVRSEVAGPTIGAQVRLGLVGVPVVGAPVGSELVGSEVVGDEYGPGVNSAIVGAEVWPGLVGVPVVGAPVGTKVVGSEVVGPEVVCSDVVGSEVVRDGDGPVVKSAIVGAEV